MTKVGKDLFWVQIGNVTGKLSFDDMAWAKRRLTGQDLVKDVAVTANPKQVLKPGDVIEVRVKKIEKEQVSVLTGADPAGGGRTDCHRSGSRSDPRDGWRL